MKTAIVVLAVLLSTSLFAKCPEIVTSLYYQNKVSNGLEILGQNIRKENLKVSTYRRGDFQGSTVTILAQHIDTTGVYMIHELTVSKRIFHETDFIQLSQTYRIANTFDNSCNVKKVKSPFVIGVGAIEASLDQTNLGQSDMLTDAGYIVDVVLEGFKNTVRAQAVLSRKLTQYGNTVSIGNTKHNIQIFARVAYDKAFACSLDVVLYWQGPTVGNYDLIEEFRVEAINCHEALKLIPTL
jgi:hypothetical protein